jgi:hypothetical protein
VGLLLLLVGVRLLPLGVNLGTLAGLSKVELGSASFGSELLLVFVEGHDLRFVGFRLGLFLGRRGVAGLAGGGSLGNDLIGGSVGLLRIYRIRKIFGRQFV